MAKAKWTLPPETPRQFHTGDWVSYFHWNVPPLLAEVIGYGGPVGRGGEHIYRLRHIDRFGQVFEFQQPESGLKPADPPNPLPMPVLNLDLDY
jgi:hypothetical protein